MVPMNMPHPLRRRRRIPISPTDEEITALTALAEQERRTESAMATILFSEGLAARKA